MTTAMASFYPNASSTAWVQSTGASITALLTSAGLMKTADSGQIDWATITKAASAGTAYGYEVRTIPDTLGTLVVRFDYTSAGSGGSAINIAFQVGTGSNGSGTITGSLGSGSVTPVVYSSSAWTVTTATLSYASSWDGGFVLALFPGQSASDNIRMVGFDRTCTEAGVTDASGAIFVYAHTPSTATYYYAAGYSAEIGARAVFPSFPARLPYYYGALKPSASTGNQRVFAPLRHMTPAPRYHKNFIIGAAPDCPSGAVIDVNVLGAQRRYLSLGSVLAGANGTTAASDTTASLLVRWE